MASKYGTICFPAGAGGNHIRWLLFLDKRFDSIQSEFFPDISGIKDKIKFIESSVYTTDRTWSNWLSYEWKYRPWLDDIVEVAHTMGRASIDSWAPNKVLIINNTDPEQLLMHYMHFNLGLNNQTPAQIRIVNRNWMQSMQSSMDTNNFNNIISITGSPIFNDTLDQVWYNSIVDFFGFDNHYQDAKRIHELYTQARKRSAKDFYQFFTSSEFAGYLEYFKQEGEL